MRFLVDRCAGRRLADWLRQRGHDVLEARALGPDPGDRALLEVAYHDGRILISMDTDFGALIHLHDQPHAGLIHLPDVPVSQRLALMAELLNRHQSALDQRAVVTVRSGRIRISRHPVG